jgi:hypothetical protein
MGSGADAASTAGVDGLGGVLADQSGTATAGTLVDAAALAVGLGDAVGSAVGSAVGGAISRCWGCSAT